MWDLKKFSIKLQFQDLNQELWESQQERQYLTIQDINQEYKNINYKI